MTQTSTLLLLPLVALAPLALLCAFAALRSRRKKSSQEGPLRLVGRAASVERALAPEGFVLVDGELWRARSRSGERVSRGRANVRVVGARGCLLEVECAPVESTGRPSPPGARPPRPAPAREDQPPRAARN